MAFEQVFKNIDNALRTDEGCSSELDYVEQSSWILFLKYLDDLDKENEMAALLGGGTYSPILDEEYRWNTWAMPRTAAGERVLSGVLSEVNGSSWVGYFFVCSAPPSVGR